MLGAPAEHQGGLEGPEPKATHVRPACRAFRWGEARNPGPEAGQTTIIETVNITSASTYWQSVCERDACCTFVQEHTLSSSRIPAISALIREKGGEA
eukprot:12016409-Alexandrium_andersonii.AAC.1